MSSHPQKSLSQAQELALLQSPLLSYQMQSKAGLHGSALETLVVSCAFYSLPESSSVNHTSPVTLVCRFHRSLWRHTSHQQSFQSSGKLSHFPLDFCFFAVVWNCYGFHCIKSGRAATQDSWLNILNTFSLIQTKFCDMESIITLIFKGN